MTTDQRHTIGKQVLDVTFNGSESGAMALQSAISGLNQLGVTPAIERILDGYGDSLSVLRIDRLEVDAGAVPLEEIEERLPEMIAEALDKALGEIAMPDEKAGAESFDQLTSRRLSETEAAVDALLFFLRHGTLPATFRPQSHESFEAQLLEAWNSPGLARQTAEALASPTARQRLLAQFARKVTARLIEALSPDAIPVIEKLIGECDCTSLPEELETKIEHKLLDKTLELSATRSTIAPAELRETLLAAALSRPEVSNEFQSDKSETEPHHRTEQSPSAQNGTDNETARQTLDSAPPAKREIEQKVPSAPDKSAQKAKEISSDRSGASLATPPNASSDSRDTNTGDRAADNLKSEQTNEPSAHAASGDRAATVSQASFSDDSDSSPTASKHRDSGNQRTPLRHRAEPAGEHPDERRGLYVENAGLVLLHPFLPQFFRALQIAGEYELLRPGEALRLLHFLATGSEDAPEYDLVLPKILCGLSPASLAGESAPLSGEEREESSALLSAVIHHWDALKNTGIDALRESFLKRNGKLTRWHDGGWLLQVESNSFDILLDQLPWGFSMIRLPWMAQMLHVEWRF
ncbi:contractile injection system tape measure protein [Chlorobaculum sp. MV4-Y]|uniref:contractile injection system tape measure protein n=1 Tax=Chlorobaculum sp. MV4-Y TaxID=2976335 RepID=UPI0021AF289E|nr:contractile injection system tape measure protein [Chlorobaculum sp. MV4-Y]UWX56720.1 contractile injection system tape measure protein [Chlorobaculum sp. MV4-Y]